MDVVAVECEYVDAVPAFWVRTGRPTLGASLVFRHGMVDETLATSGWTHLLEHLALHDRGSGPLDVNGSVSLLHTRFDLHGPPELVAATLTDLASWLARPELPPVQRERSVLAAETALRGDNDVARALEWRYGARGPGLAAFLEPGLARATEPALAALAARAFVDGNCALVLDGPPPAGLRLPLISGPRRPTPEAVPVEGAWPAAYLNPTSGVVASGVTSRSAAAQVLPMVIQELFTEQFRLTHAAAYAPWGHYEPVDDHRVVVLAGSDANAELLPGIADRVLVQLNRLARGDVPHALVDEVVARALQAARDPYRLMGHALRAASDLLRNADLKDVDETLGELEEIDVAAVATAAREVLHTLMLGVTPITQLTGNLRLLEMPTDDGPVSGRKFRSRNFPVVRDRLRVSADAVHLNSGNQTRTIRSDQIEGLLQHPDGGRRVVSRDGWTLDVEPTMWAGGDRLAERVDQLVDRDRHLPVAARPTDSVPRPLPAARRWWSSLRWQLDMLLNILGIVAALVIVVDVARHGLSLTIGNIFLMMLVGTWLIRRFGPD